MNRADRNVLRIKLVFVAVFAVAVALIWRHQLTVVRPRTACLAQVGGQWMSKTRTCVISAQEACEARGGWWEPRDKICARVVSVPALTGRTK